MRPAPAAPASAASPSAPSTGPSTSPGTGSFYAGTLHDAGEVLGVAASPDGKLVATAGGNSHTVVLWSTATGERVRLLTGSVVVNAVAFSPDGARGAVVTPDRIAQIAAVG